MKELVAKLDAENYESREMRQLFTGPFFMMVKVQVIVCRDPAIPGNRWTLRDRRGRFTKPGKPDW